jgi:hypothetical protein
VSFSFVSFQYRENNNQGNGKEEAEIEVLKAIKFPTAIALAE